jgi:deazaflavin-dependent oxidoreductase (nitroreductase family)
VSILADRLAPLANTSTLRLTHYGRKTGKPYEVTIWFMVEGETVYLPTANRKRQWPRNVLARPEVKLQIGNETFAGRVEEITDRSGIEHVTNLIAAKYWYTWPYVVLARLFGWQVSSAVFRVHVEP